MFKEIINDVERIINRLAAQNFEEAVLNLEGLKRDVERVLNQRNFKSETEARMTRGEITESYPLAKKELSEWFNEREDEKFYVRKYISIDTGEIVGLYILDGNNSVFIDLKTGEIDYD